MRRLIHIVTSTLVLAETVAIAQTSPDEDLIALAQKKFPEFNSNEAFQELFSKTQGGEEAKFAPDQIIKADWLKWLCTDPKASAKVTSKGIDIAGAQIDGKVDLTWAKIQFPLRAIKCVFTETIVLNRSILSSLDLQSTHLKKGLDGDGLTVETDMLCTDGFQADTGVGLKDARIGRSLKCDGGKFIGPKVALNLENARIGSIYLWTGYNEKGELLPFVLAQRE